MSSIMTASLLPGEEILPSQLPKSKNGRLALGPGLRHIPPSTLVAAAAGVVHADVKKSAVWIEHDGGRYRPSVGDLVIAQIHHSGADHYSCILTPHTPFALLGQLAFEGATRKTKPNLKAGDLVYARVRSASKWEDTEIECVNSDTGKAEGMGPLRDGMLFNVSPAFARRLMMGPDRNGGHKGGIIILELVGETIQFEVAVGRNGRVWVHSSNVKDTIMIGKVLRQADTDHLNIDQQRKLVKSALKAL